MIDTPWQKQLWDTAQRAGMQVAAVPADKRDEAFEVAERAIRELVVKLGIAKDVDAFVKVQMQAVRETVARIDVGGSPQGGNA